MSVLWYDDRESIQNWIRGSKETVLEWQEVCGEIMKISMYIIERWVKEYSPVATIVSGQMVLEGVRMFSPTTAPDPRYIYVGRNADIFPGSRSKEILLVHQNDVIRLLTEDLEDIFNVVEAIFEYYQKLEYQLMLAIHLDEPEQHVIDICRQEFGPSYIMNQKYHILAISEPGEPGAYSAIWENFQKTRLVSLEELYEREDVDFYRNINQKVHNLTFFNDKTEPYSRGVMNTYCAENGKIIGQCMIGFDRPIETADLQLVDVMMNYLNSIKDKLQPDNGNQLSEMALDAIISRHILKSEDLLKIYSTQRWASDAWFCVLVFTHLKQTNKLRLLTNLQQNLYQKYPQSVSVIKEDFLVCCLTVKKAVCMNLKEYVQEQILEKTPNASLYVGISYAYENFKNTYYYYKQAREALSYGIRGEQNCTSILECAMDTMVTNTDLKYKLTSVHPLLPVLKEYDKENHTEYYETLWLYLRNDNSFLETAKKLEVHRNTIVRRIEKLQERYPKMDLKDPDEKEYLLASFRILRILGS